MDSFKKAVKEQFEDEYIDWDNLPRAIQFKLAYLFREYRGGLESGIFMFDLFPKVKEGMLGEYKDERLELFVEDLLGCFETEIAQLQHKRLEYGRTEARLYVNPDQEHIDHDNKFDRQWSEKNNKQR